MWTLNIHKNAACSHSGIFNTYWVHDCFYSWTLLNTTVSIVNSRNVHVVLGMLCRLHYATGGNRKNIFAQLVSMASIVINHVMWLLVYWQSGVSIYYHFFFLVVSAEIQWEAEGLTFSLPTLLPWSRSYWLGYESSCDWRVCSIWWVWSRLVLFYLSTFTVSGF